MKLAEENQDTLEEDYPVIDSGDLAVDELVKVGSARQSARSSKGVAVKPFTPEQIIDFLKEVEAGASITRTCRRHGVPNIQYYKWRTQYGGMEAAEVTRMRELKAENDQLKKLLAEAHLTIDALLNRIAKFWP